MIGFCVECAFESLTPGNYAAPFAIRERNLFKQFSKSVIHSSVKTSTVLCFRPTMQIQPELVRQKFPASVNRRREEAFTMT